ncbi:MAG: molecular chaperone HtpG [Paludibacteraceae bacterium]|jgi:molecular chaperone HtpG|nr:molecular chaperone HtpG [Paludibacteraceae bacterium]MDI9536787.1 molecular chaperone HtpG [Bacteroidota bacterium]HHT61805.1 molecular chaperone HtpG [Bacteroidales bacterium]MBP9038787.1 molecular chaperone HtpG [Paludibacteraceae bacterium]HOA46100.1 molecular chaperone HtpG [Paludibacteraceae bacterium]
MVKGNIGVTTDNIFPVIKKFLYSDHEIFLRELVSNAVDATQKLKTLASVGDYKGEMGDLKVEVKLDKKAKTLTISDRGVGMTADEIEKYINQIAFSGATEFLDKYKNDANAIIGHFGLGFYSAFMVSKQVEIFTKSYTDAPAQHWSCDGSPEYTLKTCDKADRGTDIVLHIDDENKEFLEEARISTILTKYCKFLPIPIVFGKKKEWKDGKEVETAEDNIVNNTEPAWTKKPVDLKDEDYANFYRELYPYGEDPLFHIHLNVDFPFNLTGILYFPHIKNNIDLQRNKIQLYSNQVFVTDSVEDIVPDFLTLLHGVIDSPDIPLNVSRSYLQSDQNVKKISAHITKKVADRLQEIFKSDRAQFEEKWDALRIFIVYGMLTDEKFYDRAKEFALLKNIDGKFFTFDEYKELIKTEQTDKDGNLIYLYANNAHEQHTYIEAAKAKGYDVLLMDGQLDAHWLSQLEQKNDKSRYVRVDADVVEKLIRKADAPKVTLTAEQQDALTNIFQSQLPKIDKTEFLVTMEQLDADGQPIVITQNEFMRRMKDMAATGGNPMMGFYGEMPDSYNVVLNTAHPLIEGILKAEEAECADKVAPLATEIADLEKRRETLKDGHKGKKSEEIPTAETEEIKTIDKKVGELRDKKKAIYADFASGQNHVKQLIDLALLANNMLKGKDLADFVKRSVDLLK